MSNCTKEDDSCVAVVPKINAFLKPRQGPALALTEGETWIGRGSFEVPRRLKLLCSRRQARIFFEDGSFHLECHGTNPLYFVVCQSINFGASPEDTNYHAVAKGDVVKLTHGDQFYFIRTECLLTFNDGKQCSGFDAIPISPLQKKNGEILHASDRVLADGSDYAFLGDGVTTVQRETDCSEDVEVAAQDANSAFVDIPKVEPIINSSQALCWQAARIITIEDSEQPSSGLRAHNVGPTVSDEAQGCNPVIISIEDIDSEAKVSSSLRAEAANDFSLRKPQAEVLERPPASTGSDYSLIDLKSSSELSGEEQDYPGRYSNAGSVTKVDCTGHTLEHDSPVPGMESVVVTISGYTGVERAKLIKLINIAGAIYLGNLSQGHTHVVCWKFSGEKYHLSKKWGKIVINHRWFEESLKFKRRLPEEPYTWRCGLEVGPIQWEETRKESHGKQYLGAPELTTRTQTRFLKELDLVLLENVGEPPAQRNRLNYLPEREEPFERESEKENEMPNCIPRKAGTKLEKLSAINRRRENVEHSGSYKQLLGRKGKRKSTTEIDRQRLVPTRNTFYSSACRLKQNKVDSYVQVKTTSEVSLPRNEAFAIIHPTVGGCQLPETDNATRNSGHEDVGTSNRRLSISSTSSGEITCVICHDEYGSDARGLLHCGHDFCFDCIRKWAHRSVSTTSTCPLCKASFDYITKREPFIALDGDAPKQYCESVVMVSKKHEAVSSELTPSMWPDPSCIVCTSRDAHELLLLCSRCTGRAVHTFCLDPPWSSAASPWVCGLCLEQRRYRSLL